MRTLCFASALVFIGCGARVSIDDPQCRVAFNDCLEGCEANCPTGGPTSPFDPTDGLQNEIDFSCSSCVEQCKSKARSCDDRRRLAPAPRLSD